MRRQEPVNIHDATVPAATATAKRTGNDTPLRYAPRRRPKSHGWHSWICLSAQLSTRPRLPFRRRAAGLRGAGAVLTVRRLALGSGFKYLMDSIAVGDGAAEPGTPLTRYYESSGTPPGVWMGAGLAGLNGGAGLAAGSEVTADQLGNMLGLCVDPVSGEPCGRKPNAEPAPLSERVARRVARLPTAWRRTSGRRGWRRSRHRSAHALRTSSRPWRRSI